MAYTPEQKKILLKNEEKDSTLTQLGTNLGTYYLADNPKHYEIQRSNNFVFYIEGLEGDYLNIPQNTYAQKNASDIIKISCSKAFVPTFTQSVIQLKRGNNTLKFAGTPEFSNGQIQLNDFIGAGTSDVLYAWQQKSYNSLTEKVGLVTDYKKDGYLLEYTPDYQLVRTWKLFGCWISSLSFDEYNHDSAEKHNITATIEYDKAVIDTSDIAGSDSE